MGININLYQDSYWFVSRWDHWIDAEIGMVNMEPILKDYPTMLEAWRASGKGACKIMCIGEPEDIQRFYEWLVEHTAGLGIAMGNASQAAKDAADMVALTNEEDGAARALVQAFGLKV